MSDSPTPIHPKLMFESYNGMSRPAMFLNIPIMPMVGLLMGGLIAGVTGTALLSWIWGLMFLFPFFAALVALRLLCSIDVQYLRRVRFALRRIRLNFKYGRPLLLTPFNPNWSKFYGKRFSQQRYARRSESTTTAVSGGRLHDDPGGEPAGERDPAQGDFPRDPQ
ncbi:VirB3 family type IV secretion system protein [Pseudomonas helleri]|uniref:VirB3 family type IV secretion system protein n=1 Tax=Pseudomonas helleri TaxID=1608996 RepID=UPI003FD1D248